MTLLNVSFGIYAILPQGWLFYDEAGSRLASLSSPSDDGSVVSRTKRTVKVKILEK
jgi:hypothetical protein